MKMKCFMYFWNKVIGGLDEMKRYCVWVEERPVADVGMHCPDSPFSGWERSQHIASIWELAQFASAAPVEPLIQ